MAERLQSDRRATLHGAEPLCRAAERLCSAQSLSAIALSPLCLILRFALPSLSTQMFHGEILTSWGAHLRAAGQKGAGLKRLGGDPQQSDACSGLGLKSLRSVCRASAERSQSLSARAE